MNSITTENLAVAYEKNLVIDNLDMSIPRGKITAIIGPNGCGKSTLLKAAGRILKPKKSFVYLNGEAIQKSCPPGKRRGEWRYYPSRPPALRWGNSCLMGASRTEAALGN